MNNEKLIIKRIVELIGTIAEGAYFTYGIILGGWSPMLAAAGYWLEEVFTLAVTTVVLLRIKLKTGKNIFLGRYIFIYGFVLFVHTVFFIVLSAITARSDKASDAIFEAFFSFLRGSSIHMPSDIKHELIIIALVVIASVIYTVYFRTRASDSQPALLINRSFGAVIAPHFLLIIGVGGIILTGAPSALTAALVLVKVLIDMTGVFDKGSTIVSPDEK